jgi:hypothetical protein
VDDIPLCIVIDSCNVTALVTGQSIAAISGYEHNVACVKKLSTTVACPHVALAQVS